jgi:hypothetical protein
MYLTFQLVAIIIITISMALTSVAQNFSVRQPTQSKSSDSPSTTSMPQILNDHDPFAKFTQFTAVMSGALIGPAEEGRIYRAGSKIRTDSADGGYVVSDVNTHDTFANLAGNKGCIISAAPGARTFPYLVLEESKVERTPAGEETTDGHLCEIENVTITQKSGHKIKLKIWEAQDLKGFPIKVEQEGMGTPRIAIYKDVRLDPPDPKLFKRPANCQDLQTETQ